MIEETLLKATYYKKKFKDATNVEKLFSLLFDIVSVVGRVYIVLDALDSCPNNAIPARNLIKLSELGLPLKILVTALEDANLGPILQDTAMIKLEPESISCDVPSYVSNQLTTNFPHLANIHPELSMAIITGAGGNVGWARYIVWGLARSRDDAEIEYWKQMAIKGQELSYGRQFDQLSQTLSPPSLILSKIILRILLVNNGSELTPRDIHDSISKYGGGNTSAIFSSFGNDNSHWSEQAVQSNVDILTNLPVPFVSQTSGRYFIANDAIREYLMNDIPPQRPQVPHLWLSTDTCVLKCQLKHKSHAQQYEDGSLKHIPADYAEFVIEPSSLMQ